MTDIEFKVEQQNKRAAMVRERDALNCLVAGGPNPRDGRLGFHPGVIANARAESRRLTEALGKMPPNAGRAFRRASRERASRVKPSYPLPEARSVIVVNEGTREQARRVRQIAAGVLRARP